MDERHTNLTRRSVLLLAGAGVVWAGSSDFWQKKEPADWTPEQVDKFLSKSPWAKPVTAQGTATQTTGSGYPGGSPGGGSPGGGYPGGGYPGGGYPPIGMPRGGGMGYPRRGGYPPGGGYPGGRRIETRQGTVRWESARPVLAAQKNELPEAFANHYVISVSGFPIFGSDDRNERGIDELKLNTTLRPKGKDYAQPGVVQPNGASSAWLFGFSKDALTLTPGDKEAEFTSRIGGFLIKTTFNLKDMLYRGELAV